MQSLYEKALGVMLNHAAKAKHPTPIILSVLEEARLYLAMRDGNAKGENRLIVEYIEKAATKCQPGDM